MLLFAALCLTFTACGDDKDEPVVPTQNLESVYENESDAHFMFDIDLDKDSSRIYLYNIKFSEQMPVTVNVRIDAPVTVDKTGKVFTFAGTDIIPFMLRSTTWVPAANYIVTNLTSTVNTKEKTYHLAFDCHGGHYENSGLLK